MDPVGYFARLVLMERLQEIYYVLNFTRGTVLEA